MDESVDKKHAIDQNLLYPELMQTSELISILRKRYIQNEDLDALSKEGLVELYYSYVLPLPQRKYRMNRRGRDMTKKQVVMAKKRKATSNEDSEPPQKKSGLVSSFNIPSSSGDRLKPPPSCIDFSKKKISLSSKPKAVNSLATQLENTNLNSDCNESKDTNNIRTKIVKITLNSSGGETTPKKIKLSSPTDKRKHSPSSPDKLNNFQSKVNLINKHLGGKVNSNHKEEKSEKETVALEEDSKQSEESPKESSKKRPRITRIPWP